MRRLSAAYCSLTVARSNPRMEGLRFFVGYQVSVRSRSSQSTVARDCTNVRLGWATLSFSSSKYTSGFLLFFIVNYCSATRTIRSTVSSAAARPTDCVAATPTRRSSCRCSAYRSASWAIPASTLSSAGNSPETQSAM